MIKKSTVDSFNPRDIKKIFKKVLIALAAVLFLVLAFTIYWQYYFTYSDGYRSGLLQKFSRKGSMFKTYEGEMILSNVSTNSNNAIIPEKFNFSVADDEIVPKLDSLQGEFVTVRYKQKNSTLWWRGETVYIVVGIEAKKK